MKYAGRIAKGIVVAFVAIFNILFIFRCCVAADRSTLAELYPTEGMKAAYADGEIELITHPVVREISENGYMSIYAYVYSPEAKEVQVTVRYNDSAYEYTYRPAGVEFTYTLTDSESGVEYPATVVDSDEWWMYNFRRLSFTGVEMSEASDLILIMSEGGEELSRDIPHYADQNVVNEPYKLSRAERAALSGQ